MKIRYSNLRKMIAEAVEKFSEAKVDDLPKSVSSSWDASFYGNEPGEKIKNRRTRRRHKSMDTNTSYKNPEHPEYGSKSSIQNRLRRKKMDNIDYARKVYSGEIEELEKIEEKKKKKKSGKGLWHNIHKRRKAGKRPKRPGEEGYPETLDI